MTGLSKHQVVRALGCNQRWVEELLERGALRLLPGGTPLRPKVDPTSLQSLSEGFDYVRCRACGALAGQLTTKHLRVCSGMTLSSYLNRFEIDGCYWHRCPQCDLVPPSGYKETEGTRKTDRIKETYLRKRGWTFLRLWEHEIRKDPAGCVLRVQQFVLDAEARTSGVI